jgi:predicted permease
MVWQNVRYALRVLGKHPGFSASVVLTLAVGIGANIAMFSAVNAILLRPLPFANPEQLIVLQQNHLERAFITGFSYPGFLDWREQPGVFQDFAAYSPAQFDLTDAESVSRIPGAMVSGNFLSLLGVSTSLGRSLTLADERDGGASVAVISHDLWQRRFGSERGVLGSALSLNGRIYTIVGVLPPGFRYPDALADAQVWIVLNPQGEQRTSRALHWLNDVGRLKPGITLEEASVLLNDFQRRMTGSDAVKLQAAGLRDRVVRNVRTTLWLLSAIAGFVLVIVCANVANLQLARMLSRDKEVTIRRALGAKKLHLLGHFTAESLTLSLAGGIAGLFLAAATVAVFKIGVAGHVPMADSIHIAPSELLFGLALSSLVGVVLGTVPFQLVRRSRLADVLTEQHPSSMRHGRFSSVMIAAQIALALVLSIGMGLMGRSMLRLSSVDAGFNPKHLITFSIGTRTLGEQGRYELSRRFLQRLAALPYVKGASTDSSMPSSPRGGMAPVSAEARPTPDAERVMSCFHCVGPDYFRTLQIPIRKGRDFSPVEQEKKERVVVISEGLARVLWPNQDPLGRTLAFVGRQYQVIGVSADMVQGSVKMQKPHHLFLPFDAVFASTELKIVVRTESASSPVISSARAILRDIGPTLPLYGETSFVSQMNESINQERFTAAFLAVFASISVLLIVIGIYGIGSYMVNQRAREVGIRMALGARKADILAMILKQGLALLTIGGVAGIAGAVGLTRFLSSSLYGVSATDPTTFAGVTILIAAASMLACYVPARRAAKTDPMEALRQTG